MFKQLVVTVTENDGHRWGFCLKADLLKVMNNLSDLKESGEIKAYSINVKVPVS